MKRVVVTGMGLVTSLGHNVNSSWSALIAGQSGIRSVVADPILKNEKPYNLALIRDFDFSKWKVPHASSRLTAFLAKSTAEALQHSQLNLEAVDKERFGVCVGSLASSTTKMLEYIQQSAASNYKNVNRLSMLQILTNIPAATIGVQHKLKGPSLTVSSACASGLSAIVQAYKWIKLGEADIAFAGASEDVYNPLYTNSSVRLQAMTTKAYDTPQKASCPFDKNRSGFVLGEGAGMVVLQSLQHAQKRGAKILAQITGYGYTCDGFHLVRPESSGQGQVRAMKLALQMANTKPQEVDHVNVHATSTEAGDQIEARSLLEVFGKNVENIPVSAIKSSIGHTFAGAGVIQTIFGLKSMQENIAPKILNLNDPDVQGPNYARQNVSRDMKVMLKNSFGFGGINVSCVFKKM